MSLKPLTIGNLTIKYPIIQGGMGVGVSRFRLAGAVAKAGGMGIISTAQIGYDEPDFEKHQIEANLKAIEKHVRLAKEIGKGGGGAIGVNIMVATKEYERYVKAACEAGADTIISGAGLPVTLPGLVKDYKEIKIAPIVSSKKAASVILKRWDRRFGRTADFIVIEGPKAGGHLGFSKEQLECMEETDYDIEIRNIIEVVKVYEQKYSLSIPVIVAGGIFNHADILYALSLGADGVQIATPFVVTEECDASQAYKQAYLNAKKEDIRIVVSPVGMPGRAIMNPFLEEVKKGRQPVKKCFNCLEKCDPLTTPYCITKALINAVQGDVDHGLIFCGSNVGRLHKMTTVPSLMKELAGVDKEQKDFEKDDNMTEIRKCREEEIGIVGNFYDKVVAYLETHTNYPKWVYQIYPSVDSAAEAQRAGAQFICMKDGKIAGAFVLNDDPQGAYEKAKWHRNAERGEYLVFHALAADPELRGSGIGEKMVQYGINFAKEHGYKSIRLDVIPGNIPAIRLYEKMGFAYIDTLDLEREIEGIPEFALYEREIE